MWLFVCLFVCFAVAQPRTLGQVMITLIFALILLALCSS